MKVSVTEKAYSCGGEHCDFGIAVAIAVEELLRYEQRYEGTKMAVALRSVTWGTEWAGS